MPGHENLEIPNRVFVCSFCAKAQTDVVKLIAGLGVFICDECVARCVPLMAEEPSTRLEPQSIVTPEKMPTEQLMLVLSGYNGAFASVDKAMQDVVDILREREVSWAVIGERLGVTRQAAWKRFG